MHNILWLTTHFISEFLFGYLSNIHTSLPVSETSSIQLKLKISYSHEIPLMEEHGSECVLLIRLLLAMTTSETSQIKPDHLNPNSRQTMKMRKIRETEKGRHYDDRHENCSAFISSTSN